MTARSSQSCCCQGRSLTSRPLLNRRDDRQDYRRGHLPSGERRTHSADPSFRRRFSLARFRRCLLLTFRLLPFFVFSQIHYLCHHTYSSTSLYPTLDLPPSITQRDNLLAASLLAQEDGGAGLVEGGAARSRAMNAKMRFVADLRSKEARRGRSKGDGGAGGCPDCGKAVRV